MNRTARLRVAVSRIDPKELRAIVHALNQQDLAGLHPAERSALRALRASRSPAQSILQPHYGPALQPLAEVLTHDCLEATRKALGDAADEPDLEQLQAALAPVRETFPAPVVALMLAVTAASDAPAADLCDHVLDTDAELGLREVSEETSVPPPARTPRPPKPKSPKAPKSPQAPKSAHKPWKGAKGGGTVSVLTDGAGDEGRPPQRPSVGWRTPQLPARYAGRFDPTDRLSGAVVIAEVPFVTADGDGDPLGAKLRPCVVVAGSEDALLVRAGYTGRFQAESWRSTELVHWRRAGLEKPTHIESEFRQIDRKGIEVVGRLVEEDWNALW